MALERSYVRQVMISLFDKEATYNSGPGGWGNSQACSMKEFSPGTVTEWNDEVQADADVVSGVEFTTKQELVRQDFTMNYEEPRTKPNSIAGLMGLALGTVSTTQDGAETAYRHKLTPASALALPSVGVQVRHDNGQQRKYTGVKAGGYTFSRNGSYWQISSQLMGSGQRDTANDPFAAAIIEDWLRWGDTKFFIKPTGGTPLTIPPAPAQGATNLGGGSVDLSSRVLNFSHALDNTLAGDLGYRPGSRMIRQNLHPARRNATLNLTLECDDAQEATELDYYLNQTKLALEVNIDGEELIAAGGTFKFGAILIFPLLQFSRVARGAESERETIEFTAQILDDLTNPTINLWAFNAQATYFA